MITPPHQVFPFAVPVPIDLQQIMPEYQISIKT